MKYVILILASISYVFIIINFFGFSRNLMIGATILSTIIYFNLIKSTFPKGCKCEIEAFKRLLGKGKKN
ncbi:MAG: hypothetical protein HWD84_05285 [Flavobacteriaceae bacterium]|nr:hypothetical protein [Flavobacteriaceae bacterium]NVJ72628.1 hypothetical protein [Flavobacteriaceae bacterium]